MLDLFSICLILLLNFVVTFETVTVNPLCPTNKIAPRRRISRGDHYDGRTFGAFYDLLGQNNFQHDSPGSLQETPQNDDTDDCGEIEDYDENDLSSVTPKLMRRIQRRPFFDSIYQQISNHIYGITKPQQINDRYKPTRPPTGGYFGTNGYRPPVIQEPSAHIKPVHESGNEPYITYRPNLVGAPNAQIIGATQVKPFSSQTTTHTPHISYINYYNRMTTSSPQIRTPSNSARKNNREPSILGSFIDLLFK